jgi:cytochrome oxidase assembly protein ShyY1
VSRRRNLIVGWTLATLAVVLFANLGLWQSRRAVEKQAMLDAAADALSSRAPQALALAADPARARHYDWARGSGEFADSGALLLDNQQRNGRAGIRAYRIFRPESGAPMLVDLGWLPLAGDRRLPDVPRPPGRIELRGLLAPPPSTGLEMGAAMGREGDAWLLTRVDPTAITRETGLTTPLAPRVLRLDPKLPIGYERDLELLPNTLPPEKHRGYALQWFALALAALATALILTFRKPRRG